jgi:Sulfite reductase, beta subunit (hemoprotein)
LHFGTYAQRQEGVQMQRIKIPGGYLTADQLEGLADASDRFGSSFIHFTTREDAQIYYVSLDETPTLLRFLADKGITPAKLVETQSGTLLLAIVPVRQQQNLSMCGLMLNACFATWSEISSTRILVGSSKSLSKVALKITPHCESTTLVSGPLRKLGTGK